MKNYKTIIALVAAGMACSAFSSHAALTSLTPGNGTSSIGTVTGPLNGTSLADITAGYSFGGGIDTGTIESIVLSGNSANTLGGLTFEYIITVKTGDLSAVGLNVFNVPSVLVGVLTGLADPASGSSFTGASVVNFSWNSQLVAGNSPTTVIVGTGLSGFEQGTVDLQDSHPDGSAEILVPVPEPTTVMAGVLMLLPLGIGAVRSLRKDRTV